MSTGPRLWHAVPLVQRPSRSNVPAIHSFHRFIHTIRQWQNGTERSLGQLRGPALWITTAAVDTPINKLILVERNRLAD